jgi:nucleoside-diphosphate-sugar epimerase
VIPGGHHRRRIKSCTPWASAGKFSTYDSEEGGCGEGFLTGGSGYIGGAVTTPRVRRGHEVEALARSDPAATTVTNLGATAVPGTLGDLDVLRSAASRADGVIHLARSTTGDFDLAAASAMQDGIGAGPYVHTGGVWVYGDTRGLVGEGAPVAPPEIVVWRLGVEERVLARAATGERPILVQPGLVYGNSAGLIDRFFTRPGKVEGSIQYLAEGANRWALVHVEDIAALYVAALSAAPGAVYVGVGAVNPASKEVAVAISRAAGLGGRTHSVTIERALTQMGPLAEAFALDQQLTSARARDELGWIPERIH